MKILLVENEESVRYVFASFLELEGHTVIEATSCQEGLDALERGGIDAVVTDINCGEDGGGYKVAVAAERNGIPHNRIITMSTISPWLFLKKPFDPSLLTRLLLDDI